jgi:hypothetical protein
MVIISSLRISMVTDTYEQILNQYQSIEKSTKINNSKKNLKKFA